MDKLILPPIFINLFIFIISLSMALAPGLISGSTSAGFSYQFAVNTGASLLIGLAVSVALAFGVRVLGSGFSENVGMIILRCVVYGTVWGILSGGTFTALHTIPLAIGDLIFAGLSILYAFGVFLDLGSIGGSRGTQAPEGTQGDE